LQHSKVISHGSAPPSHSTVVTLTLGEPTRLSTVHIMPGGKVTRYEYDYDLVRDRTYGILLETVMFVPLSTLTQLTAVHMYM